MVDWDPFGIDNECTTVETPTAGGYPTTVDTASLVGTPSPKTEIDSKEHQESDALSAEGQATLADALFEHFKGKALWDIPPSLRPDLEWTTMTASKDHWPHKDVKFETSKGIAYVTFNRPNENNTLNDTLCHGLNDAVYLLHQSKDIRVAVFTGEGRMYCAGGDPKSWQAAALAAKGVILDGDGTNTQKRLKPKTPGPNLARHIAASTGRAIASGAYGDVETVEYTRLAAAKSWQTIALLPQFTICLLNGSAMGGGVGCVCCCDYVIAVKKAYVVVSEVKIGVIPATISPYVVAKIGPSNAKRLFNTAENMKAERAKEVGIANEVVENMKEGHKRVREICEQMVSCAPEAVTKMKELVFTCAGQPIAEPIMYFTALQAAKALKSEEAAAGRQCEIDGKMKPWENMPITPLY